MGSSNTPETPVPLNSTKTFMHPSVFADCLPKVAIIIIIELMAETTKIRRVIVNADDFGFSLGITDGILRAHREGIVTSTTVAANLPGAEEAVGRIAEVRDLAVGVHLNVSQGTPLSREGERLADRDGVMQRSGMGVILECMRDPSLLDAIQGECDAQIRWVLDHGITPTHLDTHRHAHAYGPIFSRVAELARRYHIRFVRRCREVLPRCGWTRAPLKQRCVSHLVSFFGKSQVRRSPELLGTLGTWGLAHTGLIDREWLIRAARVLPVGATEIMTHPGFAGDVDRRLTRLIESRKCELEALCDPRVREAFEHNDIELTHYGHL